ncbi:DUF308 domain-containing protein [Methanoculleus chikugoensis]|uniref:DUF308 domain-containing protein n=1 Tax=Methanoculleus chikugoensis TaxID=118126 RepID=UPI0006D28A0B|nr:DUF308 domain-containing protein [Methanoculleus chikugoensis]
MVNTQFGAGTYESGAALAPSRWLVLLLGVIAVIFGVLFFIYPPILTLEILVMFLGLYWLFNGIVAFIGLFTDKTGRGLETAGRDPRRPCRSPGARLSALQRYPHPDRLCRHHRRGGLIIGAVYMVQGFSGAGWGTGILGILSIIFGLVLIANPLVAAVGLVLLLAGGLAIVGGIAAIVVSFRLPGG